MNALASSAPVLLPEVSSVTCSIALCDDRSLWAEVHQSYTSLHDRRLAGHQCQMSDAVIICRKFQNSGNIHKPRIITVEITRRHHEFSRCHGDLAFGICFTLDYDIPIKSVRNF